jgi:HK97 family phage major capsid protein
MSSTFATNNRLVLFGDFGAYHIQEAGGLTVIRADELRLLNHQVVFLAFQRSDGALAEANAVRYLRTA